LENRAAALLVVPVLLLAACRPQAKPSPTAPPQIEPSALAPTAEAEGPSSDWKIHQNDEFGLSFQFPPEWYGPEEYVSDGTLRVEIGSDKVYPYGTDPLERTYESKDSYYIVIQYSRNDQNGWWSETYQSLSGLQDGEANSGARSEIQRLRPLQLGPFAGFEYISTLSSTAQTEPVYGREVLLVDQQSGVLTVSGSPANVEVGQGMDWREVYRSIDEANMERFREIVGSLTVQ
jgi:hypothetical protein